MSTAALPKSYTPGSVEPAISAKWAEARAFHADPNLPGEPFSIVIPPPNVTAALHLGHALNNTLQDVLIRAHRMGVGGKKYKVLWMPGTDHAGIATQSVVEKRLQLEGKKRTDFTREEFIALVQEWKDEYEATITEQLKSMGASCDFERQRFTMDPICAKAVREAFFRLFKDGLIYRGKRLVNWDPVSQTALADDEVEMEEVDGQFYYLRYPLVHPSTNPNDPFDCQEVTWSELAARGYPGAGERDEDENAWVTVATTRPETYLGDTAVAVNPKDPRARALEGQCVQLPLVGRVIPIITDDYVVMPDPESSDPKAKYATGFLKVTPAHDPNDWEIGQRHSLPVINVMGPDASISDKHGWPPEQVGDARVFLGKSREEARKLVVKEFERRGLLEASKPYRHSVGHSYRSHVPIEPYLSDQWYVKVSDDKLVGEAQRALSDDQFEGRKPRRDPSNRNVLTSRDRKGADQPRGDRDASRPPLNPCAFFISFTSYGNWLHGDERGSVDRLNNVLGEPMLIGDEERERQDFRQLKQPPMTLDNDARPAVQDAIAEVCQHRGWPLIALHVRTNHVHAVVIADTTPERVMNDFKAYATRKLRERKLVDKERRVWTRHGSTRYLNDDASAAAAATYVIDEQGEALEPAPIDNRARNADPLPNGRGSLRDGDSIASGTAGSPLTSRDPALTSRDRKGADEREDAYDNALRFTPARYAKMYQGWHEGLRDWCISRQLWWGHRIPVWHKDEITDPDLAELHNALGSINARVFTTASNSDLPLQDFYVCNADERPEVADILNTHGLEQDPDVLDTWFSSALWPMSTMGWPAPGSWPDEIPEGEALLDTFNPTSVLLTAREIITLWVSRMVMFNRYFNDGKVPFYNVYIHAMIQDGHGQKMSKSLGNGVDPRDIIHSHGADAMRFTLVQMTTGTQDVRLPVDIVCPHCGETFHPPEVTASGGYRVAAPQLDCTKCGKKMASAYGAATGEVKVSDALPLARNTSSKFDLGRNFANKLWNAARFALSNLNGGTGVSPVMPDAPSMGASGIGSALHITRRNLPHWQLGGSTYFVTFRLREGRLAPAERKQILDACLHWHGERAHVHLVTVMPDHVHLLLAPMEKERGAWWPLSEILHSIKSFTAHAIQKARGSGGVFWQDESFDRIVRDEDEFLEKWDYMVRNPVTAGLVERVEDYAYTARPSADKAIEALPADTGETPVPPVLRQTANTDETPVPLGRSQPLLVDTWIINRLHSTLHKVEDAIAEYQFAPYAEAMYDFIWRDFCDWYLEAIKPTVKSNAAQQQVLRTVLNAALRLLHPIMPFVTEALWPSVQAAGAPGIPGVKLPPSDLLATAPWPDIACKVHDKEADSAFDRVQNLVNVIRNVRGEHKVQPKQRIGLIASPSVVALVDHAEGVAQALAGLESVAARANGASPGGAVAATFEGDEILLTGISESVDVDAERARLARLVEEKVKAIASLKGRLANEAYVSKAPAHLVEETKAKLVEAEADLAAARGALESL